MLIVRTILVGIFSGLSCMGSARVEEGAPKAKPEVIYFGAFCPDGKLITVGSPEEELEPVCCSISNGKLLSVWDVRSGKRLEEKLFDNDLEQTAVSPDGKLLASWNTEECDHFADGAVRIYTLERTDGMFGAPIGTLGGPICQQISATFAPDSKSLAVSYCYGYGLADVDKTTSTQANQQNGIRFWDMETYIETGSFFTDNTAHDLKWSPDGRFLAGTILSTDTDGMDVQVWELQGKTMVGRAPMPEDSLDFGFSADSRHLVIGGSLNAYKLPESGSTGKLEKVELEIAKAEDIVSTNHLEVIEDQTSISLRDVRDPYSEIRVSKKNPRAQEREDSGVILNVGMLVVSADGRHVLIDSSLVDMREFDLRKLDLLVPKNSARYELQPLN